MSPVRDRAASGSGDFWSRRKARVAVEEAEAKAAEAEAEAAKSRAALEEKSDAEILAELDLKDPDTLETGDDFTAFLRSEVPERLRRRALRRLWRSNAVLANLDSLVDYGEDYTDSARVVENLQTAYRVGKGMLGHVLHEETAEVAAAAPDAAAPEDAAEAAPDVAPPECADTPESVAADGSVAAPGSGAGAADVAADPDGPAGERDAMPHTPRSPRRMKFLYT